MARTVVTGGAGFIGSALVRHLLAESDDEVIVLDSFTYAASPDSLAPLEGQKRFTLIRQDIRDFAALQAIFARVEPDAVIHLAAESHVDRSIAGSAPFLETNVMGTYALLEAARLWWSGLKGEADERFRFLHLSTDEVFGSLGPQGAFTETSNYDPSSPYSATKAAADHLVNAWHRTYGLPVLMVNCSNNFGPRQFPEKLIPLAILNLLERRQTPVYGDGLNVRDWIHVEDHARALDLVLRRGAPGARYLVGARQERRNIDVVNAICDRLDRMDHVDNSDARNTLISYVSDRPGHDRRYAIDPSRIERDLGYNARYSFEDGLDHTIDWYRHNEAWWRPLRGRNV